MPSQSSRKQIDEQFLTLPTAECDSGAAIEEIDAFDPEVLRTFTFEVSAGRRPKGVADATNAKELRADGATNPAGRRAISLRRRFRPKASSTAEKEPVSALIQPADGDLVAVNIERAEASNQVASLDKQDSDLEFSKLELRSVLREQAKPSRRRIIPAWVLSMGAHLGVVSLLATLTFATVEPPKELEAWFAAAESDGLD